MKDIFIGFFAAIVLIALSVVLAPIGYVVDLISTPIYERIKISTIDQMDFLKASGNFDSHTSLYHVLDLFIYMLSIVPIALFVMLLFVLYKHKQRQKEWQSETQH